MPICCVTSAAGRQASARRRFAFPTDRSTARNSACWSPWTTRLLILRRGLTGAAGRLQRCRRPRRRPREPDRRPLRHGRRSRHTDADLGMQLQRQLGPILSATLEAAGAAPASPMATPNSWPVRWRSGPSATGRCASACARRSGSAVAVRSRTAAVRSAKQPCPGWLPLGSHLSLGLEAGRARAFDGAFAGRYAQLTLGMAFADAATAPKPRLRTAWCTHAVGRQLAAVPASARPTQRRQPEHLGPEVPAAFGEACVPHRTVSRRGHRGCARRM